jgi:hypothetical protein
MNAPLTGEEDHDTKKSISQTSVLVGAMVLLVVVVGAWFVFAPSLRHEASAGADHVQTKMSAAAQEYVSKMQVGNIAMSRAENFLHQEVTIVNGEILNSGNQKVSSLLLTAQFTDDLNQVVLRETRNIIGGAEHPIAPGERRAFEISFEHVPASWNMQQPSMHIDYLELSSAK